MAGQTSTQRLALLSRWPKTFVNNLLGRRGSYSSAIITIGVEGQTTLQVKETAMYSQACV